MQGVGYGTPGGTTYLGCDCVGWECNYGDAYVAKFSSDCTPLLYATYYGGSAMDTANCGKPCRKLVVPSSGSMIHW